MKLSLLDLEDIKYAFLKGKHFYQEISTTPFMDPEHSLRLIVTQDLPKKYPPHIVHQVIVNFVKGWKNEQAKGKTRIVNNARGRLQA